MGDNKPDIYHHCVDCGSKCYGPAGQKRIAELEAEVERWKQAAMEIYAAACSGMATDGRPESMAANASSVQRMLLRQIEENARLEREVERLRAIVSRLPKTEDGVPIYHGMPAYRVYWDGSIEGDVQQVYLDTRICTLAKPAREPYVLDDVYFTREAAEKARKS